MNKIFEVVSFYPNRPERHNRLPCNVTTLLSNQRISKKNANGHLVISSLQDCEVAGQGYEFKNEQKW